MFPILPVFYMEKVHVKDSTVQEGSGGAGRGGGRATSEKLGEKERRRVSMCV